MYKKAWKHIIKADSILLISHIRPDGDTLGSILALYSLLKSFKKKVYMYNPSENFPKHLKFLPHLNKISKEFKKCDLNVVCDCGSLDRTRLNLAQKNTINIDHHKSNTHYGKINLIEPSSPSTTLVVYKMLRKNDIPISKEMATSLYVGFLEDTGFFSYGNITSKTFKIVAKLCESGIDIQDIHRRLKQSLPLSVLRLRQFIYNNFKLYKDATIAVAIIKKDDLQKCGCNIEDTKNIISLLNELVSVKMACLLIENGINSFKISLRSKDEIDVSEIAQKFGGGGHKNAAGFEIKNQDEDQIIKNIIG